MSHYRVSVLKGKDASETTDNRLNCLSVTDALAIMGRRVACQQACDLVVLSLDIMKKHTSE